MVEVTNPSRRGFWLVVDGVERFVPYRQFPWFRGAALADLRSVVSTATGHLRWPRLDIDLTIDSIEHPERYPLVSRT